MAQLSREEREKLVRTSFWTGIGMGLGLSVAGSILLWVAKAMGVFQTVVGAAG